MHTYQKEILKHMVFRNYYQTNIARVDLANLMVPIHNPMNDVKVILVARIYVNPNLT